MKIERSNIKNIDTIMDFISDSINNPEFDNFTTNDIKNYLIVMFLVLTIKKHI